MATESAHAGKTVNCFGPLESDESHDRVEVAFEEHGRYVRSPPRSEGFESSALRFDCPECPNVLWVCPVCSDPDDNTPPGWFRGDSTGDQIPCHNCNQEEINARMRHHGHAGTWP